MGADCWVAVRLGLSSGPGLREFLFGISRSVDVTLAVGDFCFGKRDHMSIISPIGHLLVCLPLFDLDLFELV